jgi:hypothetical protein
MVNGKCDPVVIFCDAKIQIRILIDFEFSLPESVQCLLVS